MPICGFCGKNEEVLTSQGLCGECAMRKGSEKKESKITVEISRSAEIEALQEDLENQKQIISNQNMEREDLEDKLRAIADKELDAKLRVLAKDGYDISGIISTQDQEEKVSRLRELELQAKLDKEGKAPVGGNSPSFYQIQNQPSKEDKFNDSVRQAMVDRQDVPLNAITWDDPETMKNDLRKIAMSPTDPRSSEARQVLSELTERIIKSHGFEAEYQGSILDTQKKSKKKGEWRILKKGEN